MELQPDKDALLLQPEGIPVLSGLPTAEDGLVQRQLNSNTVILGTTSDTPVARLDLPVGKVRFASLGVALSGANAPVDQHQELA